MLYMQCKPGAMGLHRCIHLGHLACLKRALFSHRAQASMHTSIPTIQEAQSAPHAELAMGTVQL
jgi:hypothetical protein